MRTRSARKLFSCSIVLSAALPTLGALAVAATPGAEPSWTEKVTSGIKSGTSKAIAAVSPKSEPESLDDGVNGKPGPMVYIAMAQMAEKKNDLEQAETHYRKALELDSNNLGALLGLAHMKDKANHVEEATTYYQKAVKKHPKEGAVHNNFGMCYHRRGKLKEAARSLQTAVDLVPHRKLYRDNLAAVLVDQGKNPEALKHLVYAHGDAAGNYNLGYLLEQKADHAAALEHFRKAAELDPSLTAASQWVAILTNGPVVQPPMVGTAPARQAFPAPVVSTQTGVTAPVALPPVAQRPVAQTPVAQTPAATPPALAARANPVRTVSTPVEKSGLRHPQGAKRQESSGDAVPPLPEGASAFVGRLPSVTTATR